MLKQLGSSLFRFFSSFGLAVAIFLFLFVLILFGTLYQVDHGLYEAQNKYFSSFYVMHAIGPVVVPLPGGYLLTALLAVNLICGGLMQRRVWRHPGVVIVHIGIMVLIASAAITYHFSDRGHLALFESETNDEIQSFHDWSVRIGKAESDEPYFVVHDANFKRLRDERSRTFHAGELPFDVELSGYVVNAFPRPAPQELAGQSIDGYMLEALPPEKEAEANLPAVRIAVIDRETDERTEGILAARSRHPLTIEANGDVYTIDLVRKRFPIPFEITLDEFIVEFHPGTEMAESYESYVTKSEGGAEEKVRIWMNHPLRDRGYTFFQQSWGRQGNDLYSVFEVVRNPADQGPLIACIIISVGFLIHFLQKLVAYMRAESKRRTA